MEANQWFLLLRLCELDAHRRAIFTSTTTLAKHFNCSQQTVSRWLRELLEDGYVERKIEHRGEYISITKSGVGELARIHSVLSSVLKPREAMRILIKGRLFSGLGEGAYYITREGYSRQFSSKLGFKPYPGTLNLRLLTPEDMASRKKLEMLPGVIVDGFNDGVRTYGMLKCIPTTIDDKIKGAVVLIQRTHHNSSVIEVIAPIYIRKVLKLKDNDVVSLEVQVL